MFCRFCKSKKLQQIVDLGNSPIAGEFLKKKDIGKEKFYPLAIYECLDCSLVQLFSNVAREELFQSFLSSIAMKKHFEDYAQEMVERFIKKGDFVVEIGSNDGVLLLPLKKVGINVLGIEPIQKIAKIAQKKKIPVINQYFSLDVAKKITVKADAVFANNVFAHIEDLDDVMLGIKTILKENGIFVFEVHFLLDLIQRFQYDTIYHEHLNYYSVASLAPFLKKYDFEIFEVKPIATHSGSIRVYTKQLPRRRINEFAEHVLAQRETLLALLADLKDQGKTIIGYGAAGRGNTLLNYCKIDTRYLDYIVDESPLRYNRWTPGTHIPVISPKKADFKKVDYVIILAWNYEKEIREKLHKHKHLKFILPLPKVQII